MKDCPFCTIKPNQRVLAKNNYATAFLAKDAIAKGQSIVIPTRHITSIFDATKDEICDIFSLLQQTSQALTTAFSYDGYNIISNSGTSAGQTVDHLHFHLIPRAYGDAKDARKWLCDDFFKKLYQPSLEEFRSVKSNISCILKSDHKCIPSCQPTIVGDNVIIGKNVAFGNAVKLYGNTHIHDDTYIGDFVSIGYYDLLMKPSDDVTIIGSDSIIRSGSVIYRGVKIGNNFDCSHNVIIRNNTTIGDHCYILSNTQIHTHVTIGNRTRIQGIVCNRAVIGDDSSSLGSLIHKYRTRRAGDIEDSPIIENNVVVGVGSIVIGGVRLGSNSTIGAGAIVTKDVKNGDTYF